MKIEMWLENNEIKPLILKKIAYCMYLRKRMFVVLKINRLTNCCFFKICKQKIGGIYNGN